MSRWFVIIGCPILVVALQLFCLNKANSKHSKFFFWLFIVGFLIILAITILLLEILQ